MNGGSIPTLGVNALLFPMLSLAEVLLSPNVDLHEVTVIKCELLPVDLQYYTYLLDNYF